MESKQTPIDYIKDNLFYPIQLNQLKRVLNEAGQMHKEQIMDAYSEGFDAGYLLANGEDTKFDGREQYYNETYGKD